MSKSYSSNLLASLANVPKTLAFCILIEKNNGTFVSFTTHDKALTFDGHTFLSSAGFDHSAVQESGGLETTSLQFFGAFRVDEIEKADVESHLYDLSKVTLYVCDWNAPTTSFGKVIVGRITNLSIRDYGYDVEFQPDLFLLEQTFGEIREHSCSVQFGSTRCGLTKSSYTYNGTVSTIVGTGRQSFTANIPTAPTTDDWFGVGYLTFTSGENVGLSFEVYSHTYTTSHNISLLKKTPFVFSVTDAFTIVAGCRKRFENDCILKYNNAVNFQGDPYLPMMEEVYIIPDQDL